VVDITRSERSSWLEDQRIQEVIDKAVAADEASDTWRLRLIKDALDLVVELWPKPGYATVALETHQWVKLRQLLLAVPELVAANE
jgi:hypothetical protein